MPSADDTQTADDAETGSDTPTDEAREGLLAILSDELGDALVASHLKPGDDLWIRVTNESWSDTADYLRNRQRFRFFDFVSAIDWMPSPYGRSLSAAVDDQLAEAEATSDEAAVASEDAKTGTGADGYTGGDTRFQVFARVYNLTTRLGVTLKADVDESMSIGTWINTYPGAAWQEREAHEMFGITFTGNADMRNIYLPGDFEGNPLRKDYPLMARIVKPWPGIVDVEPMPATENPEDAS